jgi:hypothetical protein
MNHKLVIATLGAVVATAVSASAFAQSCASPSAWQPPAAGDSRTGNTCLPAAGGQGDDSGSALICGGLHDRKGPVYAFASTFSAGRTFTTLALSGGAAGFDPVMYMTPAAGGCGANQETCSPSGDAGVGIATADVPDGSWIIFVTAADIDNAGACGAFTLTSNGSFPVTLTNFTVS